MPGASTFDHKDKERTMSEVGLKEAGQATESAQHAYPRIGMLIGGDWIYDRPAHQQVVNPSNEAVLGPVPRATSEDLDRALAAAAVGFEVWRKVAPTERSALLHKVADIVRSRTDLIAPAITLEQGKPLADARAEVHRAASFLDWDAEQILRRYGRVVPSREGFHQMVVREPVGPVAAFTPWNVPISAPSRKISGSLAAGCSVIIKPAGETPAATCLFAQCFLDAGIPAGVVNVVHGASSEISTHLIGSDIIRMVTLTGSVGVGKTLARLAAEGIKPSLMELGGHAPVIIDEGVDPVALAKQAVLAKFRMAGQICASPTRFIAHRGVYEPFVDAFARAADALVVGDGFEAGVDMGPLVNAKRVAEMEHLVDDAVRRGARIAAGGRRLGNRGCFYAPTVLADVPLDAEAMTIEPFGPMALCLPVDSIEEAIRVANRSEVGLAGFGFSNNIQHLDLMSGELQTGMVSLNGFTFTGPEIEFGGVKESGVGREGGEFGLDAYSVSKTVMRSSPRI
jgi:succinate-semialdehyde dehydrogenase / glutarate-semialdehyde dehydrogenase